MSTIGNVVIKLTADHGGVSRGLERAEREFKGFGKNVKNIVTGAGITAVVAIAAEAVEGLAKTLQNATSIVKNWGKDWEAVSKGLANIPIVGGVGVAIADLIREWDGSADAARAWEKAAKAWQTSHANWVKVKNIMEDLDWETLKLFSTEDETERFEIIRKAEKLREDIRRIPAGDIDPEQRKKGLESVATWEKHQLDKLQRDKDLKADAEAKKAKAAAEQKKQQEIAAAWQSLDTQARLEEQFQRELEQLTLSERDFQLKEIDRYLAEVKDRFSGGEINTATLELAEKISKARKEKLLNDDINIGVGTKVDAQVKRMDFRLPANWNAGQQGLLASNRKQEQLLASIDRKLDNRDSLILEQV